MTIWGFSADINSLVRNAEVGVRDISLQVIAGLLVSEIVHTSPQESIMIMIHSDGRISFKMTLLGISRQP